MNRVLPLSGNRTHHTGSPFGEIRNVGHSPHGGIDFNYTGGQSGINQHLPDPAGRCLRRGHRRR